MPKVKERYHVSLTAGPELKRGSPNFEYTNLRKRCPQQCAFSDQIDLV